jgi:flagellar motor switch protein FliN/FliY
MDNLTRGLNAFARGWCDAFANVCEMVTGSRPELKWNEDEAAQAPGASSIDSHFWWNQTITGGREQYSIWIATPNETWKRIVAALDSPDQEQAQAAFGDMLSQTLMTVAQQIAGHKRIRLSVPSSPAADFGSKESLAFRTIQVEQKGERLPEIHLGVDRELASSLHDLPQHTAQHMEQPKPADNPLLDRLIDLEVPVSAILGRTALPIRDVLNITPGSMIELGNQVGDAVELVVENAVVARGEVVSVRGNYGVRINQLISRQERLTLGR